MHRAKEEYRDLVASLQYPEGDYPDPDNIPEDRVEWFIENGWYDFIEPVEGERRR